MMKKYDADVKSNEKKLGRNEGVLSVNSFILKTRKYNTADNTKDFRHDDSNVHCE